jgi:hypothetical protein
MSDIRKEVEHGSEDDRVLWEEFGGKKFSDMSACELREILNFNVLCKNSLNATTFPLYMSGIVSLNRSALYIEVLLRHLRLPLLTVVRGFSWEQPSIPDYKSPRIMHVSLCNALKAFNDDTKATCGVVLNLEPLALLVIMKSESLYYSEVEAEIEAGPKVNMLLIGSDTLAPTIPYHCVKNVHFTCPDNISVTSCMTLSRLALTRTALVGLAIHACATDTIFENLCNDACIWATTLSGLHETGHPMAYHNTASFSKLADLLGHASYTAHRVVYHQKTNKAMCSAFGLTPSYAKTAYVKRDTSALFCFESVLEFRRDGSSMAASRIGKKTIVKLQAPGYLRTTILSLNLNADSKVPGSLLFVVTNGSRSVCIMMPQEFSVKHALYEYDRVVRELREKPQLYNLLASENDFVCESQTMDLNKLAIYINLSPVRFPYSGKFSYPTRLMENMTVSIGFFPTVIIHLIGSFVTIPTTFAETQHPHNSSLMDSSLKACQKSRAVFITMNESMERLYSLYPDICPIRCKNVSQTMLCGDFLHVDQLRLSSVRDGGVVRNDYLSTQHILRSPLHLHLSIGQHLIVFPNCGHVGAVITSMPSLGQILERAIGCFVKWMIDENYNPDSVENLHFDNLTMTTNPTSADIDSMVDLVREIPIFMSAKLSLVVRLIDIKMEPLSIGSDFLHYIRFTIVSRVVYILCGNSKMVAHRPHNQQQATLTILNNSFLIIRDLSYAYRIVFEVIIRQLKDIQQEETLRCSPYITSFPAIKINSITDIGCWNGIRTEPWLTRMMRMDAQDVLRVNGDMIYIDIHHCVSRFCGQDYSS